MQSTDCRYVQGTDSAGIDALLDANCLEGGSVQAFVAATCADRRMSRGWKKTGGEQKPIGISGCTSSAPASHERRSARPSRKIQPSFARLLLVRLLLRWVHFVAGSCSCNLARPQDPTTDACDPASFSLTTRSTMSNSTRPMPERRRRSLCSALRSARTDTL